MKNEKPKKLGQILKDRPIYYLELDELANAITTPKEKPIYRLYRENDGLTKVGAEIGFIEWDETGRFKKIHDSPEIGRSIILDPKYSPSYTWMTSAISEIISETRIRTNNSIYTISQIESEELKND